MGQKEHQEQACRAAVVVPVYKEHLSRTDKIALQQLQRVLGKHPKIFMAPESLSFDYGELGQGFAVERFPDAFFRSQTGYSVLLLQPDFYRRFLAYDYILIYQTDAFVFADRLQEFCALGYDYIGAPVGRLIPLWHAIGARVGNGGFSLRRVSSCLQMLEEHGAWLKEDCPMMEAFLKCEDAFFAACAVVDARFRVPDVRTALSFAVQDDLQHAFRRMKGGWRPFGCHGWTAGADQDVWKPAIAAAGYDLRGVELPDMLPFGRTQLKLLWDVHRELPLHRIYALLQRGQAAGALHLIARCLGQYPETSRIWRGMAENFCYLWRMARTLVQDAALQHLLQEAFEEGLCRCFLAGSFLPMHVRITESLVAMHCKDGGQHGRLRTTLLAARRALDRSEAPAPVRPPLRDPQKKVVAITMVKNEMDIIESFVRHTLGFADVLLVADHQSTDRTRPILEQLQAEGLPVRILPVTAARYAQADVMTRLLWEAADGEAADIVLPLDADEFLVPTGAASVRALLEALSADGVQAVAWRRYVPRLPDGIPTGEFPLALPLYRADAPEKGQKVIVGGALVRRDHVRLNQGSHEIVLATETGIRSVHGALADGMEIAHFFWRSPAQIRSKYAVGWPNIAANYTKNTPSGGSYRASFQRIQAGGTPDKNEGVAAWDDCDLRGRVPLPELRYSEDTVPDAFQNLLAASEALAEELAETRALAGKPVVTTVLPYLGDEAALCAALASACAEDYPAHDIVVVAPGGALPEALAGDLRARGIRCAATKEALLSAAAGAYVEWLLPGAAVRAEKLRRMAACMELQDLPYPLLLSDGGGKHGDITPYIDIEVPLETNFQILSCRAAWERLLEIGKYPSRGLAGLLVRREVFTACGGLFDAFAAAAPQGGHLDVFSMWRQLLLAGAQQPCTYLGVLREDLSEPLPACTLEDMALHQMDWIALCRDAQEALPTAVIDRQRRNGIALLEQAIAQGCDMQAGVWAAYQKMLVTI